MKQDKISMYLATFLMLAAAAVLPRSVYPSPYGLSAVTDSILAGSGAALYGISFYTEKNIDPLTDSEIERLSKKDINRFDRSAAYNWSPAADRWSTGIVLPLMISPLAFLTGNRTENDFITIGIIYSESLLITEGLNRTTKNIVQRKRPYTYNSDAPISEKKDKDAVLSFYSYHTAHAFNSAVFVSTVFSDYYPDSIWRYTVWGTSISAASITGYLRYRAGKHFPTDIIAGAAIGSLTGWMVPALHRRGSGDISVSVIPGEQNSFAVIMSF